MHIRNPVEWFFTEFDPAASGLGAAAPTDYWTAPIQVPIVNKITRADLTTALRAGVQDFAAARTDVIFVCLIYPIMGLLLAALAAHHELLQLLFPIASGFALIGPFAAIGLYEMSRRRELTGRISWFDAFAVLRSPSLGAICLLGAILMAVFLLWLAVAEGLYDVTLGPQPPASAADFLIAVFTTGAGVLMALCGLAAGAVFAVAVLAISVVSFPLLLDRPAGIGTAMRTSVRAVRKNPGVMALWGFIVAAGLVLGSLPALIGLVVVLPILGHSTWHLYRRLIT